MIITCPRTIFTDKSTISHCSIDTNSFTYDVLEPPDRGLTINTPLADIMHQKQLYPNAVAIPTGTYQIGITWSNRFQRLMPEILNVPGFVGVREHWGNFPKDTDACQLTGTTGQTNIDWVGESMVAFDKLFPILQEACGKEKVYIVITNNQPA